MSCKIIYNNQNYTIESFKDFLVKNKNLFLQDFISQDIEGFKEFLMNEAYEEERPEEDSFLDKFGEAGPPEPSISDYIDWNNFDKIQKEYFAERADYNLKNRPEHHSGEATTWEHTQNVVRTAQTMPIPNSVKRDNLVLAALYHDLGKPFRNEDHAKDAIQVINDLFQDTEDSKLIKLAVRYHMINVNSKNSEFQRMIRDAQNLNLNIDEFRDLLFALKTADIIRGRNENEIEPETGKTIKQSVADELTELEEKFNDARYEVENYPGPSTADIAEDIIEKVDLGINVEEIKTARALELADKMSTVLGVDYEIISAEQAAELTKDAKNPYAGQPAFFFGGKVYFISDRITTDTVLHEFSHPFIRAIAKENPELFDALYKKLSQTEEGKVIIRQVQDMYPGIEEDNPIFKEEALVLALQKAAAVKPEVLKRSVFGHIIDSILYTIKQLLRRKFGKNIKVANLDASTTLNELALILTEGDKITIDTELISEEDIVAYMNTVRQAVTEDFEKVQSEQLQGITNTFYDVITTHINKLLSNNNFDELSRLLLDEYDRGELQSMRDNLSKWETSIKNKVAKTISDVEQARKRAQALSNTLMRLKNVMEKIRIHADELSKQKDTQAIVHKMHYYKHMLDNWEKFINELNKILQDSSNNVPANSPIFSVVSEITNNLQRAQRTIAESRSKAARDAIFDQLEPMQKAIRERYEEVIKNLKKKNTPYALKRLDQIHKEYYGMSLSDHEEFKRLIDLWKQDKISKEEEHKLYKLAELAKTGSNIDRDIIELTLHGKMGDANFFSSYLEGYLYNPDPVIGGLALYIKNAMNDVATNIQQKAFDFAEGIREDLIAAGYNPNKIGELGKKLYFKDNIIKWDHKTGEYKKTQVWTFLNPYKDYRAAVFTHRKTEEDAYQKWLNEPNDENEKAYLEAKAANSKFLRDYMHQEFTAEYYKRDEILIQGLNDTIGQQAAARRDKIIDEIRSITESNESQSDELEDTERLNQLWREYAQLHSMYDLNGKLKTGDEEKIAARLREYREASRELYEDKLRTGVFENAYMEFLQELRDKGVAEEPDIPDSLWNQKIQEWKDANTRKVIKSEFYEKRDEILAQIKQILSKLPDAERKAIDQGAIWEKIIAITSGYRDTDGQINGAELSEGQLKEIKTLQEELQHIRSGSVKANGLTTEENQLYYSLLKKRQQSGLTAEEKKQYTELFNKKTKAVKLTRNEQKALDTLYEALGEMSIHNATEHYVDIMNNWLSKLDTTKYPGTPKSITQTTADELLDYDLINNLLIQDKEFKKWFQANHILREYKDKEGNNIREYVRTYAWNVVTPTDPAMYELYNVVDKEGNVTTIEGLPARKYYSRQVKLEYRTERIVGVTVDNMGQPLPKSREEMAKSNLPEDEKYIFMNEAYEAMDKNSPLYRVLEKFKEFHLANQQGISRSAKLYLDTPRFRKSNLELIETGGIQKGTKEKVSLLTNLARRFRNFFIKTTDDVEDGVMNWNSRMMLVRADMFDDELTDIPIAGLYDIEIGDTSTDVTNGVLRYMQSAEHHKKLLEISPIAKAIEDTVNDPANAIKDINRVNKREMDNRNTLAYLTKKDHVRQKAVTALNERELQGKSQAGFTKDYPWMTKVTNLLFKRASFSFFALNIPSALKNSLGMKFQAMIEATAGNYTDMKSLHLGNVFAYKAMAELSFSQAYTKKGKSFTQQFVDVFDMAQRYEEKMGQEMSRTVLKDVASMTFWFSPRKFVELQAAIQIGTSILYHQKVTQTLKDGTTKEIPYAEAFESRDGKIRLKEGIDIRYDVQPTQHYVKADDTIASIAKLYNVSEEIIEKIFDKRNLEDIRKKIEELQKEHLLKTQLIEDDINTTNELISKETDKNKINNLQIRLIRLLDKKNKQNSYYEKKLMDEGSITIDNTQFKMMKNRVHQVINNLAGAYAKFDQPEAFRWFLYRMIIFLRRYFTTMAMNRFGFRGPIWSPKGRPNPGLGDVHMGYYVQFLKTLAETVRSLGQNIPTMTKEEVKATIRFFTEIGGLIITTQLCAWLFGWDPDDEDRFKKLKAKSGPMGMLGLTSDDDSRKFNLGGYLELHTLHLLMQVRAENEQFNPITGGLKQYNSLLDLKSVALGPTTDSFTQIISDLNMWIKGDDRGRYARKVGPYEWQDKDNPKFLNHFAKMFGVTGTSLDPALAIQNFQAYQSKIRR